MSAHARRVVVRQRSTAIGATAHDSGTKARLVARTRAAPVCTATRSVCGGRPQRRTASHRCTRVALAARLLLLGAVRTDVRVPAEEGLVGARLHPARHQLGGSVAEEATDVRACAHQQASEHIGATAKSASGTKGAHSQHTHASEEHSHARASTV